MNANQRIVIFNRAPLASANGWIHIVPKGELPNAEAGIVQVLDDASLDSILAGIEKDRNRLGDKWPGIYAGREHFIYDSGKDSAALGWFKDFDKRADGIWAKDDGLTPAGAEAVKNRDYKFTSFVADPKDLKKVEGNKYRVLAIETVGFTNYANGKELLNPITNRDFADAGGRSSSSPSAANQQPQPKVKMKNIATKLGLAAEASEEAILAEVTKLQNRVTTLEPFEAENTRLTNRIAQFDTEQVDGLLADRKITDAKIVNRLKPVLAGMKTREERVGFLDECGFKAPETKPAAATRVLNRGTGDPNRTQATGEEQAEQARATKIMNRANQLCKDTPHLTLATAVRMAQQEIGN